MSVTEPFENKIGNTSNDRVEIVAKGRQRIPIAEISDSSSNKRFPIEEDMWDLPGNAGVTGYHKVRKVNQEPDLKDQ